MSQVTFDRQELVNAEFEAIMHSDLMDLEAFDIELQAEREFAPEDEIYGRSLGTVRRLGGIMLDSSHVEAMTSPEAKQAKIEFFTSVEEGFGTDMELGGGLEVRGFDAREIINGRVMAKDLKTPISEMTKAGLVCADKTMRNDSRFLPQYIRSVRDHQNALTVDSMTRGETNYNTRIVVSPFPEEAAAKSGEDYWRGIGYVPHLKRSFVQLYHVTNEGRLMSGSLSFDGSNKDRIRQVFEKYGVLIPEHEVTDNWLNYAITRSLSEEDAKALAVSVADLAGANTHKKEVNTVNVTDAHKPLMERVFNESYLHVCESLASGDLTPKLRNLVAQLSAYKDSFKEKYARTLSKLSRGTQFTNSDAIALHEILVYSTIEMMRTLHISNESNNTFLHTFSPENALVLDTDTFQAVLGGFAADGASNNRVYSACGLSISMGGDGGPQSSYGGIDNGEDMYGPLDFQCAKGHWNRRQQNTLLSNCATCGDSVKC